MKGNEKENTKYKIQNTSPGLLVGFLVVWDEIGWDETSSLPSEGMITFGSTSVVRSSPSFLLSILALDPFTSGER